MRSDRHGVQCDVGPGGVGGSHRRANGAVAGALDALANVDWLMKRTGALGIDLIEQWSIGIDGGLRGHPFCHAVHMTAGPDTTRQKKP